MRSIPILLLSLMFTVGPMANAQTAITNPQGKSITVTENGGGGHLEDRLIFSDATRGTINDPDGDIDSFTYSYSVTGTNTADLRIQLKPDKWNEYKFVFDGAGGGTYQEKRFDKNAFKDQRTGEIVENSGAGAAPAGLSGLTIDLVEAPEAAESERLDFLTGSRGRKVEPGDVDPFLYVYEVTGPAAASAVLTFKLNLKWNEYDFVFLTPTSGTFTVDRFDKGTFKDTKSGTFTIADNVDVLDPIASGFYDGVLDLHHLSGVDDKYEGLFRIGLSPAGGFSGTFKIEDKVFKLRGGFDDSGHHQTQVTLADGTILTINLELEAIESGYKITGEISDDSGNHFVVDSDQRTFDRRRNPAPQAGRYNLILTGDGTPAQSLDIGDGIVLLSVSSGGVAKFVGLLGDGQRWAAAVALRQNGDMTLLSDLYRGTGSITGRVAFADVVGVSDLAGILHWTRPAGVGATSRNPMYQAGFEVDRTVVGAAYAVPDRGVRLIGLADSDSNLQVNIEGGGLPSSLEFLGTLSTRNRVVFGAGDPVSVRFNAKTGVFSGLFRDDSGAAPVIRAFVGLVLQKQSNGAGLFVGSGLTGRVEIGAP